MNYGFTQIAIAIKGSLERFQKGREVVSFLRIRKYKTNNIIQLSK